MKNILISVLVSVGLLLLAKTALAADYYVAPAGNASWLECLNASTPCSWQTAMANAAAGDTVYFRGGTYDPGVADVWDAPAMHPAHDGVAGNPIVLKAYPGETPVIYDALDSNVAPANNSGPAAGCYQNSYVTWDGFTFDRVNNNGYQASSIVRFELSDHCSIINSDLIGRPQLDQYNGALIHIVQSSYIYITNNKLHGMSCGVSPSSTCVNATAVWSFDFDHVYINNNDIYDNNNALSSKIGTSYLYIYNNHIWNSPRAVINYIPQVDGTTDASIYQNVIRNSGPALYSPDAAQPFYNLKFYNNTIYNQSASALATIGNGNYTNSRNAEVFNNIISVGGSGSIFERFGDGSDKPAYADFNDFYGNGDWRVAYSATYNTLADWQTAMGLDLNSITSDPLFINAGGINPADYKLRAGSPARIGRGGAYASVMGAYIAGDENIGYSAPASIDLTPPSLVQVTAVFTPTTDTTPDYVFSSDEAGIIAYGGDCSSAATSSVQGNNTITFNSLPIGVHSNCTITVTDSSGNSSIPLSITAFTIDAVIPPVTGGGSGGTIQASGQATTTASSTSSGQASSTAGTINASSTATANVATSTISVKAESDPFVIEAAAVYDRNQFVALDTGVKILYAKIIGLGKVDLDDQAKRALALFIQEGTASTGILGSGERAGVLGSYYAAYDTLPKDKVSWQDAVKIALGRWPKATSSKAEAAAEKIFKQIYLRTPKRKENKYDNNAVSIIAYGLRPAKRNLTSEKAAIKSFRAVFKRAPSGSNDWDIVRAIAYSGAKR